MKLRDVALLMVPQLGWGIAFPIAKPAFEHFPTMFAMAMVYGITAAIMLTTAGRPTTPAWRLAAIALLAGSLQAGCIFWALARLPASTAMLLVQAQAPASVLAGWAIRGERPRRAAVIGIGIAIVGIAIVAGAPELPSSLVPVFAVIFGAACWSTGQALVGRYAQDDGTVTTGGIAFHSAWQLALGSLLFESGQIEAVRDATLSHWALILQLALFGFVMAYAVWYGMLKRLRLDQVVPFTLTLPVITVLAAAIGLGERPSWTTLLGCAVVLGGVAVIVRPERAPAIVAGTSPA